MASLLLAIIYIAFISLGLPDAVLGSAWPSMYPEMQVPVSYAGIISMIISSGTVVSSLLSDRIIRRFSTHAVTTVSVGMTAAALLGFSVSSAFWQLCLWAIPYGLGAGSVDAALNNYIALHYKSRHMSWLHCFWGLGAMMGPYIVGAFLTNNMRWNNGYLTVGLIQVVLVVGIAFSRVLWKSNHTEKTEDAQPKKGLTLRQTVMLRGAKPIFIAFFCYCALETTTGLWASSYLVLGRDISAETAASWASLFYIGITVGRLLGGFISDRLGDRKMVLIGQGLIVLGIVLLALPLHEYAALCALICIGVGCAPIYPSLLHETPVRFGAENSQAVIGMQMASAYIGSTCMPSVFGFLSTYIGIQAYPFYLLFFGVLMFLCVQLANRAVSEKK